jgi:hypothetical protein
VPPICEALFRLHHRDAALPVETCGDLRRVVIFTKIPGCLLNVKYPSSLQQRRTHPCDMISSSTGVNDLCSSPSYIQLKIRSGAIEAVRTKELRALHCLLVARVRRPR